MLSYRRDTALQGAVVLAKSRRLELGDNILRTLYVYLQNQCDITGLQSYRIRWKRKIRAIAPFKVIQDHPGRYQSKARKTFYWWLIVTDILSSTVSELSQLIVQILDNLGSWAAFRRLRDYVRWSSWAHWKERSGLPISVNWTFSLSVMAEALRAQIDRKSAISLQRGHFDSKFCVEGAAPPIIFAWIVGQ